MKTFYILSKFEFGTKLTKRENGEDRHHVAKIAYNAINIVFIKTLKLIFDSKLFQKGDLQILCLIF